MMGFLQKPKSVLKKNLSKVPIRSVLQDSEKVGDGEPAGRLQGNSRMKLGDADGVLAPRSSSDGARDPLNWPTWKKETAFFTLLLSTAVVGILKTLFVTTNSVIAMQYNVSYMGATALTGIPFIVAAISSLGSSILSQAIGKRLIHCLAGILMLLAALWNMHVMESYAQFMASRIFQGVGWGAFEGLVMMSVRDIFFVHELPLRFNILSITSLFFTWGSPILGGYLSQNRASFRTAIMAVIIIQAFSVFFLLFFLPETSFLRSSSPTTPITSAPISTMTSNPSPSSLFRTYVSSLRFIPYTQPFKAHTALRPLRAFTTPSTLLTFLLTGPTIASAFGLASSLSLLFAVMPTLLFPSYLGFLFILPAILSICAFIPAAFLASRPSQKASSPINPRVVVLGIILGIAGILSFALYTTSKLTPPNSRATGFVSGGSQLSLRVVSLLLGILVAGAAVLGVVARADLHAEVEDGVQVQNAWRVCQDLLSGIFIMAVPGWVQGGRGMVAGLKEFAIVVAVLQIVGLVGVVGWERGGLEGRRWRKRERLLEV